MRILYGVSGEGFGHSSRAMTIAPYLEKKGNEVIILTYGQGYKALKNRFKIFKVNGLKLIFKKGVLSKKKTLGYNLKNFPKNLKKLKKFHKLMRSFKPDLCISDMEPIVPILSFWYKLPLISLDNQHRLTNLKLNIPKKYHWDYVLAKGVTNAFVRKADYFIVTSFSRERAIKKNTFVVSPLVRKKVAQLKPLIKNKILVYLTKKNKDVINILKGVNEKFLVYGYGKIKEEGNLSFRKRDSFLRDLKDCKAIIASSGFTLMSEAIYLKKPYFALPLKGQFEQTLNSLFLKKSGYGDYSESFSENEVRNFLSNMDKYRLKLNNSDFNCNEIFSVLDKILMKIEKITK